MTMSLPIRCALPILALSLATVDARAGAVHRVGPGWTHATLQAAVDAAADGDVVLVSSGSYAGATIAGKGVSVVEDAGASVSAGVIRVQDTPPGSTVLLSGIDVAHVEGAIRATNVLGSLRVQGAELRALHNGYLGATVVGLTNVADASFAGCTIRGVGALYGASRGIVASGSKLVLDHATVEGADGASAAYFGGHWTGGGWGADAIDAADCSVFASASTIRGGDGGSGHSGSCTDAYNPSTSGGQGGDGVQSSGAATLKLLDSVVAGGAGGPGGVGWPCGSQASNGGPGQAFVGPGAVETIPGTARTLATTALAREGQVFACHVEGVPGDLALLLLSTQPDHAFSPALHGVQLFAAPFRRVVLGTIDASGVLDASVPITELGAGVAALTPHGQLAVRDLAGSTWLGSPAVLTLLDASY